MKSKTFRKPKHKQYDITYENVLRMARTELNDAYRQRERGGYELLQQQSVLNSHIRAAQLIEMLEAYNCGSYGGFDRVKNLIQNNEKQYSGSLENRLRWLEEVRP
jgi:hypothetical protein